MNLRIPLKKLLGLLALHPDNPELLLNKLDYFVEDDELIKLKKGEKDEDLLQSPKKRG